MNRKQAILQETRLSRAQLEYICKEIIAGDSHGSFIKNFARAFVNADFENQEILLPAGNQIVAKYGLARLLPADGNLSRGPAE